MFKNADQPTPTEKVELEIKMQKEKEVLIDVCEVKP